MSLRPYRWITFVFSLNFLIASAFVLNGCGGRKVVATDPKELNIPADLAKAFEVKELPKDAPPTPVTTVAAEKPKKTKRVASKKAKAQAGVFTIPSRRPEVDPMWVGEKIWMDVTWLSTKAGEFLLEVLPHKEIDGRKVYNFKGSARTSDLFSLVYRAEDWVQTFVDFEGWFPYKFVLYGDETKHIRDHVELFDHAAKKQYVHIRDNRIQKNEIVEKKGYEELTPFSQDALSAIYYARTFPLKNGDLIKFPMTSSGKQFDTELTVMGREEVNTKMGYMKAIKTKVVTRFQNVLQQKGDAFMWFSDDERRYLLRFEAKVRIGWVAGIARQIESGQRPETEVVAPKSDAHTSAAQSMATVSGPTGERKTPKRRSWFRHLLKQNESE